MKRKVIRCLAWAFVLMFLVVTMPAFHSEAATAGWKKQTVKVKASDGRITSSFAGWKYQLSNGKYVNNCLCKIDGKYYLFKADGKMQTGATSSLGYSFHEGQKISTGTVKKANKDQGAITVGTVGRWKKDKTGYWFSYGSWYPKNVTIFINDDAYKFNAKGYLLDSKNRVVKPGTYKITSKNVSHRIYEVKNGKISNTGKVKTYSYTVLR